MGCCSSSDAGGRGGDTPKKQPPATANQYRRSGASLTEEQAIAVLTRGAEIMLLPRFGKGSPRPKFLFLKTDEQRGLMLCWSDGPGQNPAKDSVSLSLVVDLHDGQFTRTFTTFRKKFAAQKSLSWSLVSADATSLDVVMASEVSKRLWLLALRTLLQREAPTYFPPEASTSASQRTIGGTRAINAEEGKQAAPQGASQDSKDAAADASVPHAPATTSAGQAGAANVQVVTAVTNARPRPNTAVPAPPAPQPAVGAPQQPSSHEARQTSQEEERQVAQAREAAQQKSAAIQESEAILRAFAQRVQDQLGSTGAYTGQEVFMVVRAEAMKTMRGLERTN